MRKKQFFFKTEFFCNVFEKSRCWGVAQLLIFSWFSWNFQGFSGFLGFFAGGLAPDIFRGGCLFLSILQNWWSHHNTVLWPAAGGIFLVFSIPFLCANTFSKGLRASLRSNIHKISACGGLVFPALSPDYFTKKLLSPELSRGTPPPPGGDGLTQAEGYNSKKSDPAAGKYLLI